MKHIPLNIAVIDAELIDTTRTHTFPNLSSMKISNYHKQCGDVVKLKTNYDDLDQFDKVYISKVFIDTEIPFENEDKTLKNEETIELYYTKNPILNKPNVIFGGTGFYYNKSPQLPIEIEHSAPDYNLYDDYINEMISAGANPRLFDCYKKYSIGFTTRGCIRQCAFCVNKDYKTCYKHSSVYEWLAPERPYIYLLDDNVFACKDWQEIFRELQSTGKRFHFKQGLDIRLLTDKKCIELFNNSKWIGDYLFAFDNIKDKNIIIEKLQLMRKYTDHVVKFYVFCGYNHSENVIKDADFYVQDVIDLFARIKILMEHGCIPYIMRHANYKNSPFKGMYINVARWCNQPNLFKKMSYREFVNQNQILAQNECATTRYTNEFLEHCPEIEEYFDMKFNNQKKGVEN